MMAVGAISMIAQVLQFSAIFGRSDDREGSNPLQLIGSIIIYPYLQDLFK